MASPDRSALDNPQTWVTFKKYILALWDQSAAAEGFQIAASKSASIAVDSSAAAAESASVTKALRDSFVAVQGSIGYLPPVVYAAGISMTLAAQTVGYSGQTYAPILSALPFTTSGTFEAAKFRLIQGVSGADLAASNGASLVGFQQIGSTVTRDLQSKGRERVSILDFIPASQHAAILAGTSVYDASSALATALASFPNGATLSVNGSGSYKACPEIWFPAGKYYFASTIEMKRSVRLTGEGNGHPTAYPTLLQFAANITGIRVQSYNTIGETVEATPTGSGGGSIIEGFGIFSSYNGTIGHGVHIKASCELKNCNIVGFAENGVNIFASAGAGGSTEGNANLWRASNLRIQQCGGHGFFVKGADANAGTAISIDASGNGKCGILDSSFLGNTYIGCHSDSNGKKSLIRYGGVWYYCISDTLGGSTTPGTNAAVWVSLGVNPANTYYPEWVNGKAYFIGSAYRSENLNARNVFLGCYSESGSSPPSMILQPAVVIGGLQAAGFEAASTGMVIGVNGNDISAALFPSQAASARAFTTRLGKNGAADVAVDLLATGDHPNGMQFAKWHEPNKTWGAWWASAIPGWWITTGLSAETAGRTASIGPGKFLIPNGVWLGSDNGSVYRHMTVRGASPTSGEWAQGDIVYNQYAQAGGFVGWVCTAGGIPGIWKTFGLISP